MPSLRKRFPLQVALVDGLLLAAAVTFVVGIFAPMMTLTKLIFVTNTFSIVSGIQALAEEGEWFLFLVIFGFSLALPVAKLVLLFVIANHDYSDSVHLNRWLRWLAHYGKWSMLDVMVVAILLVSIKLGAIVSLKVHYGIYVFGASVLVSMLATWLIERMASHRDEHIEEK